MILVMLKPARQRASELDREFVATKKLRGPLHGVPVRFFLLYICYISFPIHMFSVLGEHQRSM